LIEIKIISYISSSEPERELKELRERYRGLFLQSINSSFLKPHAKVVLLQTLYAEHIGQSLARDSGVDFLMRLTGEDQISSAISKAGARPNDTAYLLLAGKKERIERSVKSLLKELNGAKCITELEKESREDYDVAIGIAATVGVDRFKQ